jgi:hypothetical protein
LGAAWAAVWGVAPVLAAAVEWAGAAEAAVVWAAEPEAAGAAEWAEGPA